MKIQLKRSSVLEGGAAKAPTSSQMEYGELAVNYNEADPTLFIKDSTNQIIALNFRNTAGEVPSGPTPPAGGNQIGDLFFDTTNNILVYWDGSDWVEVGSGGSEVIVSATPPATTDLEEGTLWWNSDAGDLSLYVLYNDANPDGGLKWIEASPMPGAADIEGYPDTGDGNGATLDDRYVSKTVADHKVGDLTIGADATPNITLAADGSSIFNASVTSQNTTLGTNVGLDPRGGVKCYAEKAGTYVFRAWDTTVSTTSGDENISIKADGSATFAGDCSFARGGIKVTADSDATERLRFYQSNEQAGYINAYDHGGSNPGLMITANRAGAPIALATNNGGGTEIRATINSDGSATFAGTIEYGQMGFIGNGPLSTLAGGSSSVYGTIVGVKPGSTASVSRNFYVYLNSASNSPSREVFRIEGIGNADAYFRGTVHQNDIRTGGATIELERDNPANYTTTTDSEGNETQVYNGPTLDVKERLQTKTAALEAIKAAAEDASITTLADFKSAIATALANI